MPIKPTKEEALNDLFPDIEPYVCGYLQVDNDHKIYWEQAGNPDGVPVLVVHGGPGAGSSPTHLRFFDPTFYRIILFDQRGCGKSRPFGSLKNNTTKHLVRDMEMLRIHLDIKRWHLFGGSWGSTLSLHYAVKHPEHCISMILRGLFLCEQEDVDWFLHGMKKTFPEAWDQFTEFLPKDERDNILESYYKRLTSKAQNIHIQAAIPWTLYESACSSFFPNYEIITTEEQRLNALALARMEAHYFKNEVIPPEESFHKKIDIIRDIPTSIVHGRYDAICPIERAYRFHQAWPEAEYIVVPDAAHCAIDPQMRSQLVKCTKQHKVYK